MLCGGEGARVLMFGLKEVQGVVYCGGDAWDWGGLMSELEEVNRIAVCY